MIDKFDQYLDRRPLHWYTNDLEIVHEWSKSVVDSFTNKVSPEVAETVVDYLRKPGDQEQMNVVMKELKQPTEYDAIQWYMITFVIVTFLVAIIAYVVRRFNIVSKTREVNRKAISVIIVIEIVVGLLIAVFMVPVAHGLLGGFNVVEHTQINSRNNDYNYRNTPIKDYFGNIASSFNRNMETLKKLPEHIWQPQIAVINRTNYRYNDYDYRYTGNHATVDAMLKTLEEIESKVTSVMFTLLHLDSDKTFKFETYETQVSETLSQISEIRTNIENIRKILNAWNDNKVYENTSDEDDFQKFKQEMDKPVNDLVEALEEVYKKYQSLFSVYAESNKLAIDWINTWPERMYKPYQKAGITLAVLTILSAIFTWVFLGVSSLSSLVRCFVPTEKGQRCTFSHGVGKFLAFGFYFTCFTSWIVIVASFYSFTMAYPMSRAVDALQSQPDMQREYSVNGKKVYQLMDYLSTIPMEKAQSEINEIIETSKLDYKNQMEEVNKIYKNIMDMKTDSGIFELNSQQPMSIYEIQKKCRDVIRDLKKLVTEIHEEMNPKVSFKELMIKQSDVIVQSVTNDIQKSVIEHNNYYDFSPTSEFFVKGPYHLTVRIVEQIQMSLCSIFVFGLIVAYLHITAAQLMLHTSKYLIMDDKASNDRIPLLNDNSPTNKDTNPMMVDYSYQNGVLY